MEVNVANMWCWAHCMGNNSRTVFNPEKVTVGKFQIANGRDGLSAHRFRNLQRFVFSGIIRDVHRADVIKPVQIIFIGVIRVCSAAAERQERAQDEEKCEEHFHIIDALFARFSSLLLQFQNFPSWNRDEFCLTRCTCSAMIYPIILGDSKLPLKEKK